MFGIKRLLSVLAVLFCCTGLQAQIADSVDVIHYDIHLDLSNGKPFRGTATLTMQLLRPCNSIGLELDGTVDSILVNGVNSGSTSISTIPTAGIPSGQTFTATVHYRGAGHVENYGFGGFHFDSDMSYNLGAAFGEDPHSIGRATFPCRDNFHDKATYTIHMKTRSGWTAECSGMPSGRSVDADGCELSTWEITQPVCTYIVGVSQANFHRITDTVAGYPVTIGFTTQDSATTATVYALLDAIMPKFEQCFGPYRWGRIGYIGTARGSMEHVNNIALARQAMASVIPEGQSTIAHELGHAWFGNLVTCETEGDMWINEGGATFTSEVAREATHGRRASNATYQQNLDAVIRTAHTSSGDGSYLPLHGMPHDLTYGTTTYDKGGLVWHSLRGYLGDSLFYATVRTLMDRCAFTSIDAYRLRDSLSAYSGVDLSGFFDFHVFCPGFNNYNVCTGPLNTSDISVTIRQSSIGTDSLMRHNRVPVTFFSHDGQRHKQWFTFSGTDTAIATLHLPFEPAFFVLDLDCELSDAVTVDSVDADGSTGTVPTDMAFFAIRGATPEHYTRYYVEHHYVRPDGLDTIPGVIRPANRYWAVRGSHDINNGLMGRFRYLRQGYYNNPYPNLDAGFYHNASTLDSIVLLWRYNEAMPWQAVSRRHVGNTNDGHFTCDNLRTGEYTLAVVDTTLLSIADYHPSTTRQLNLFPNPVHSGDPFAVDAPVADPFTLTIVDATGRRIWHRHSCRTAERINPHLDAGTYSVIIENSSIKLQSKIIIL